MNHSRNTRSQGFTIVEISLAMAFVATLLVAIALLTIQLSHIYTKGITLKEVNEAGQSISDNFTSTLGQTSPVPIDTQGKMATTNYISQPGGGRFCTGTYSYAWNTGIALAGANNAPPIFNHYNGSSAPIHLVKVSDPGGTLCTSPSTSITPASATELLTGGDRNLAVQSLSITETATDNANNQALYYIQLVLGTNDQTQLTAGGTSCNPPASAQGNEDYCAVNEFDLTVLAGNSAGAGS